MLEMLTIYATCIYLRIIRMWNSSTASIIIKFTLANNYSSIGTCTSCSQKHQFLTDCCKDHELLYKWLESFVLEVYSTKSGCSSILVVGMKKAGSEGTASVIVALLSMRTTEAIVGLSVRSSWTHNRPMCMHLIISCIDVEDNVGSIKVDAVPSLQLFHAWKQTNCNMECHVTTENYLLETNK